MPDRAEKNILLFHITHADDPKFLEANPAGFAKRNFGYPLICDVSRSDTEHIGGDIRVRYGKWSGAIATRHFAYRLRISDVFVSLLYYISKEKKRQKYGLKEFFTPY